MNSITALRYARAVQADREREIARRPPRPVNREVPNRAERRSYGLFRWLRFPKPAGTNA